MASSLDALKTTFKGTIVTRDSPEYDQAIHRYFKQAEKQARFVLYPASTHDIAAGLKFARDEGLALVVAGGGHSAGGASSVDDGVVLDLSRFFNSVEVVLPDGGTPAYAKVGGGARWLDVDKAGMEHGLATVAGLVNHTGVGGLTLGGGYGWLTGAHGVTSDNLLGATVVLASGEVVQADRDTNPDLFWALRGGGGAFGIVTEFRLQLHPASKSAYLRFVGVPAAKAAEAIPAFMDWSQHLDEQTMGGMAFDLGPDGKPLVIHWAAFLGPKADVGDRLKSFDDIDGFQCVLDAEMPYENANGVIGDFEPEGSCRYWSSVLCTVNRAVYDQLFEVFAQEQAGAEVPGARFVLEALGVNMAKVASVPVDATAYPNRDPTSTILQLNLVWPNPAAFDAAKAHAFMARLRAVVAHAADKTAGGYANFEALESGARALDVYGPNLARLRTLKAKFDPVGVLGGKFGL